MGAIDHDLTIDYQEMFERFHGRPKRYTELAKIVEERKFQMKMANLAQRRPNS